MREVSAGHVRVLEELMLLGVDPNATDTRGWDQCALHYAARRGHIDICDALIRHKAHPSIQDSDEDSPLHYAAMGSSEEAAQLLIEHGANPLIGNEYGQTPMHTAARSGSVRVMETLYRADPEILNINTHNGSTPLHYAYSSQAATKWLLEHNLDIDAKNDYGDTALMLAPSASEALGLEVASTLLSRGADPRIFNIEKRTALHSTAYLGRIDIAQKLLESDPDLMNKPNEKDQTPLHCAVLERETQFVTTILRSHCRDQFDINRQDKEGNTALHLAVLKKDEEIARCLFESGADSGLRNNQKQSALTLAIECEYWETWKDIMGDADVNDGGGLNPTALYMASKAGDLDTVRELIEDFNADVNKEGGLYSTAIAATSHGGFYDIVDFLIKHGADPGLSGGLFSNALSAAIYSGADDIVELLLEHGVSVNDQDAQGRTCLHIAALTSSWDTIKMLEQRQGDMTARDKQKRTILHHAAAAESFDIVSEILKDENLPNLNEDDIDGWSPLHWACRKSENNDVVQLLIDAGANVQKQTNDGWSPRDICIFHEADDLLDNLIAPATEGDEATDVKENEEEPQQGPRVKLGSHHWQTICDGCNQYVSFLLVLDSTYMLFID